MNLKQNYFETLAQTVDEIKERCDAVAVCSKPTEIWDLCRDHLAYGQTRTGDFQLDLYKGKPTRKYFHATIIRMDSGRYELTTYVL